MILKKRSGLVTTWAVILGFILLATSRGNAATELFLKLSGIKGESTVSNYVGQIVVMGFSQEVSETPASGSGGSTSPPAFTGLTITKWLDTATPVLLEDCAAGASISSAVLSCVSSTGTLFYTITLSGVQVTDVQSEGSQGGTPQETVTLHFSTIQWSYQQLDSNGNAVGSPITHSWNLVTNTGS